MANISFNSIPDNWKLPLYWVEFDPSKAGLPSQRQPALIVGQRLSTGTWPADIPVAASSLEAVQAGAGMGSMLAREAYQFFLNNRAHEVWFLPVNEPSGGVAATGTITVSTAPTVAGTLTLYVGGQRLEIGIAATDTTAQVATKVAAAINALLTLPVTASAATNVVTVTCRWKGLTGNSIRLEDSLAGLNGGESLPTGMTLTYSANNVLSGGSGTPDFTAALANIAGQDFDYCCMPFTDTTSLGLWELEFGFSDSGRWGFLREQYGTIFSAKYDTYANLMTFGPTRNSGVVSILAGELETPTPPWEMAAAYTSRAARALLNDPARPLQTLEFDGALPAPLFKRFQASQVNSLAGVGLAVQGVNASGKVNILREQNTYQKNAYSQSDDAYELVPTLHTLALLVREQKAMITSRFPRCKLVDDGTRTAFGQAVVSPSIVKGAIISQYAGHLFRGLVENQRAFENALSVQRSSTNPNRLEVLYTPDLTNQLRIVAVLTQFRLQFGRGEAGLVAA